MIIRNINLETVCGITSRLPENEKPEIAFAGKSNVGKSSLINALMNRKSYARISATPGKTQTINFYNINGELYLVDLPGYGYAKVSEKEKIQWGRLVERYLHGSSRLKAVFLLIDIRHTPSENDRVMYRWILEQGYEPVIIATKLDKLKRSQVSKQMKVLREGLRLIPGTKTDSVLFRDEAGKRRDLGSCGERISGKRRAGEISGGVKRILNQRRSEAAKGWITGKSGKVLWKDQK